jgi:hypothetical protein
VGASELAAFAEPGWGKIAASFVVAPYGEHATLLTYECRTVTTDPESRRRFLRYWSIVRPFVRHILRATLRTIRDDAERGDRADERATVPSGHGAPGGPADGGPLATCPECSSSRITAVAAEDETNFLCDTCGRCWHVELARVSRVDPLGCPGCPDRARCTERLRADEALAAQ